MPGVATSSVRRRRENRLLSWGTLIITHANEPYEDERRPTSASTTPFTFLAPEVPSPSLDLLHSSSLEIFSGTSIFCAARVYHCKSLCSVVVSLLTGGLVASARFTLERKSTNGEMEDWKNIEKTLANF